MPAKTVRARREDGNGKAPRDKARKPKEEHETEEYEKGVSPLAVALTDLVCGTLVTAFSHDHRVRAEVEESDRYTSEYARYEESERKHSEEVHRWMQKQLMVGQPGYEAIRSQVGIFQDELVDWIEHAVRYHRGHWCDPMCCQVNPALCPKP